MMGVSQSMAEQFFFFIRKHLYSAKGLITGYLLIGAIIVGGVDGFLEKGVKNFVVRLIIYGCLGAFWLLTWLFLRSYIPRNKKHKIGITIAIKTENDKQKIRIKCDFAEGIQQLLKTKGLSHGFSVQILHDYKANEFYEILQNYCDSKKEHIEKNEFAKFVHSRVNKTAEKLIKKNRGNFFISHARKPQAFKPGDEWHPGTEPGLGWRSGGESGIIWLWPDTPPDRIPSTNFSIMWCGFRNIGNGFCEAK
jgi:hypothetical protein